MEPSVLAIQAVAFNSVVLDSGSGGSLPAGYRLGSFQFCCFRFQTFVVERRLANITVSFQFCCFRFVLKRPVRGQEVQVKAFNSVVLDSQARSKSALSSTPQWSFNSVVLDSRTWTLTWSCVDGTTVFQFCCFRFIVITPLRGLAKKLRRLSILLF